MTGARASLQASPPPPNLKRKRVAKACEKCKLMKVKCDGRQPICQRCEGYGHVCTYLPSRRSRQNSQHQRYRSIGINTETTSEPLHGGFNVVPRSSSLPGTGARKSSDSGRTSGGLSSTLDEQAFIAHPKSSILLPELSICSSSASVEPYHGEISDVQFYNVVKRTLQRQLPAEIDDDAVEDYGQVEIPRTDLTVSPPSSLPSKENLDERITLYFSTLHIAYPFVERDSFIERYSQLRDGTADKSITLSWLGLLHMLLAIGSYYMSFDSGQGRRKELHELYYQTAVRLSETEQAERSLDYLSVLLARCFYLLITSKTDSCWTKLGTAIRLAQSMGLHIESEDSSRVIPRTAERRRRIWYSLYVLDRLLALQLGRPPGVHDEEFSTCKPRGIPDESVVYPGTPITFIYASDCDMVQYHIHMIQFSSMLGSVLRVFLRLGDRGAAGDVILQIDTLDRLLLEWKAALPSSLRFDIGHTFETSRMLQRQRNMLAIKFHHLRTLIHRPCLKTLILQHRHGLDPRLTEAQLKSTVRSRQICVSEAQRTAQLLYAVQSKCDLVQNFPLWQMISCLVCAGSVLYVASIFEAHGQAADPRFADNLRPDGEICLRALDALSGGSLGAQKARDMLVRLRDTQPSRSLQRQHPNDTECAIQDDALYWPMLNFSELLGDLEYSQTGNLPSEILDSFTWSAEILNSSMDY